jgi:hypothetical protein
MRKKVLILYTCDPWLTHSSKVLGGVFSSPKRLDLCLRRLLRQKEITGEDYDNLQRLGQTQGRQTNYLIEEHSLNPLKLCGK